MHLTTIVVLSLFVPQGTSSGPLVGIPHTISVSAGTLGGGAAMTVSDVYYKEPGAVTTAPRLTTINPSTPDFRISAIFGGLASPPDIDAMSIGLDWVLSDDLGQLAIPPTHWGLLSFSATPGSVGITSSLINAEVNGDGDDADIFSVVLPGSSLPPTWVAGTQRGQNSNEINLTGTSANIDAHDIYMGGYELAQFVSLLPPRPAFYFSVSNATLSQVPASWWGVNIPSGATILVTTWDDVQRVWSTPSVVLGYNILNLGVSEDIDAMAVDVGNLRMLFSTTTPTRDPLLIALPGTTPGTVNTFVYRLPGSGTPISQVMGFLTTDDLDAICALDPGKGPGNVFMPSVIGTPQNNRLFPNIPANTTTTSYRSFNPGTQEDFVHSTFIGWPQNPPMPSLTVLGISLDGGPVEVVLGIVRDPLTSQFEGGPVELKALVPPTYTLTGMQVEIHWYTRDCINPFLEDMPFPTVIRLD